MPLSREQFAERVTSSGVMSADELREWFASVPAEKQPADGEQMARELVKQKKLTRYQAEQIYMGRGSGLTFGNYVILDKLGQGGMGMVLKAEHQRMKRVVALKVLSPEAVKTPDAVRRFEREVQAAAKLEHPNIVTAYDADRANNTTFLVMQFVDGDDLSAIVKKTGPLPVDRAVDCILQAARGLEFAHRSGVIHRDIKPANLLLGKDGVVKILDMGLARIDDPMGNSHEASLTGTGTVMGTIDYMSPEQALDTKTADAQSDIYSLGCALYYLLNGVAPYPADTVMKRLLAHRESPIPPLNGVPVAVESIFRRMVAKKSAERYATMTEVVTDLQRCLTAPPASPIPVASPSLDSNFTDFLAMLSQPGDSATLASSSGAAAATKQTRVLPKSKSSTADAATMQWQEGVSDTDPQTLTSLTAGARSSSGTAKSASVMSRRTMLLSAGVVAMLVMVGLGMWLSSSKRTNASRNVAKNSHSTQSSTTKTQKQSPRTRLSGASDGYALEFDGNTLVTIEKLPEYSTEALTIEAYAEADSATTDGWIYSLGSNGGLGVWGNDKQWRLGLVLDQGGWFQLLSPEPITPRKRVHLAGVCDKSEFRFYVDGKLSGPPASTAGIQFRPRADYPTIGSGFRGRIDELRVSGTARYSRDFTPPERHSPDADTFALYHFDEGRGDVLKDSSGNNHHGQIVGAKWVKAGGTASQREAIDWLLSMGAEVYMGNLGSVVRVQTTDEALATGKPLAGVTAQRSPLKDEDLARLAVFPEIHSLNLTYCPIGDPAANQIAKLPNLLVLELSRTAVTDRGLPPLLNLPRLQTLHLAETKVTGEGLKTLAQMSQLSDLNLSELPITDASLVHLEKLPNLKVLTLVGCQTLVDGGGAVLMRFPKLEFLNVTRTSMGNPGVQTLSQSKSLKSLVLFGTKLTDEAIPHLSQMKSLTVLNVQGTSLTAEGVKQLVAALPQCEIQSDHGVFKPNAPGSHSAMSGLEFDGQNGYVQIDGLKSLDGPTTVEAWVTPASTKNTFVLFSGAPDWLSLEIYKGRWLCSRPSPAGKEQFPSSNEAVVIGRRVHVAGTWDGQRAELFLDGRRQSNRPTYPGFNWTPAEGVSLATQLKDGGPVNNRFQGQLDEVRITKAVRYDKDFTPEPVFLKDAETVALYRFNEGQGEVLTDSSGNNHHGKIFGAKWVLAGNRSAPTSPPPMDRQALSFDGVDDYVDLPAFPPMESFTVEAICTPHHYAHAQVISSRGFYLSMHNDRPSWSLVGRVANNQFVSITSLREIANGQRVTLAGVYDGKKLRLFVDGKLIGEMPSDRPVSIFRIGSLTGTLNNLFPGTMEAVRFSRGARYDSDYSLNEPWQPDESTLALYRFDEGSGDVLKDSSGHNRHGKIVGAKWVRARELTGAAAASDGWIDWLGAKLKQGGFQEGGWSREGDAVTTDRVIVGTEVLPVETRNGAVRVTYLLRDSRGIQLGAREHHVGETREFAYFAEDNGAKIQIATFGKGGAYKGLAEQAVPASISKDTPRTLEFRLVGETLTLTLNGSVKLTVQDAQRSEGLFALAATKGLLVQKVEYQLLDDAVVNGPLKGDVLSKIDVKRDAPDGTAKIENGTLSMSPGKTGGNHRLLLPIDNPPDEYDIRLRVLRTSEGNALVLGLVSDGHRAIVAMDGFRSRGGLWGLENIDGKGPLDNGTAVMNQPLKVNVPADVLVQVRKTGIRVERDGKALIDWKGSADRLSLNALWDDKGPPRFFLGAQAGFVIQRMTMESVSSSNVP